MWPRSYASKACLSHSIDPSRTMMTSKRTRHRRSSGYRCSSNPAVAAMRRCLARPDAGRGAAVCVAGARAHFGDDQQVPGARHHVELADASQEIARDDGEALRFEKCAGAVLRPRTGLTAIHAGAPRRQGVAAVVGGFPAARGAALDAHPIELAAHAALRIHAQRAREPMRHDLLRRAAAQPRCASHRNRRRTGGRGAPPTRRRPAPRRRAPPSRVRRRPASRACPGTSRRRFPRWRWDAAHRRRRACR